MCPILKKLPILLLTATLCMVPSGCKTSSTPPVLAPGYLNAADQTMGQSLQAAHSFYTSLQSQTLPGQNGAAPAYVPSPTEKTALDAFSVTLNQAELQYLAYHNGAATQAQAQAAVNAVTSAQTQLTTLLPATVTKK